MTGVIEVITHLSPPLSPSVPTAEEVVAMAGELAVVIEGEFEYAAGLSEGEDSLAGNGSQTFKVASLPTLKSRLPSAIKQQIQT